MHEPLPACLSILHYIKGARVMDKRLTDGQLVARCADAWDAVPAVSWWRHKKTGGVYEAQGVALTSSDLDPVVIYMNVKGNGPSFTRPASEFLDGRFERVTDKEP